jgi:CRP/FNR family transcriptional regulator, cyclic AMP receptor protein
MSYEKDVKEAIESGKELPQKLDIGMIRYFWQASPMTGKKPDSIPRFLRNITVLKNFTDNELRILSKSMHLRTFSDGEEVFRQNDLGVGFYFILNGYVDIIVQSNQKVDDDLKENGNESSHIITLEKFDYFGELALLQERSLRNAAAISRDHSELLGIFKPDMEELINNHPVIATKLLQSVSLIIANRLFSLTREVKELKHKLKTYERENNG